MLSVIKKYFSIARCQLSHWKNLNLFASIRAAEADYSLKGYDELRCIYAHIPKAARIAINNSLFGNSGWAHKTVSYYRRAFEPIAYNRYFSFTFVRNPYSRLVSAFGFLKVGGYNVGNAEWGKQHLSQYNSVNEFVLDWLSEDNIWSYVHFFPQSHFVCEVVSAPAVDCVGRFETLDSDFHHVCNRLGVERSLAVRNSGGTTSRSWSDLLTEAARNRVWNVYKRDFELFGYERRGASC